MIRAYSVAAIVALMALATTDAVAQSGTRSGSSSRSGSRYPATRPSTTPTYRAPATPRAGSTTRTTPTVVPQGLEGYSPVTVTTQRRWLIGSPRITAVYDGKVYQFVSVDERDEFRRNPERFVPALGGDCVVCYANGGKRVAGSVRHAATSAGRLYLFPSGGERDAFLAAPEQFQDADLAFGGYCAVCYVKGRKFAAGREEFAAIHEGLRYLFPSSAERDEFQRNPSQYAQGTMNVALPSG